MKLPSDLIESLLFKRGSVLYREFNFQTGPRNKFFIVLNVEEKADPILAVLSTSNVTWAREHPDHPGLVDIPVGTCDIFTVDTVIDCRELHSITREDLVIEYQNGRLTYKGELSPEMITRLNHALKDARTLGPREKAKILPPEFRASARPRLLPPKKN